MGSPMPAASLVLCKQREWGSHGAMQTLVHGQGGIEGTAGTESGQVRAWVCSSPTSTPGRCSCRSSRRHFLHLLPHL